MERLRPVLFTAAVLFSNAALASPPGKGGGPTPHTIVVQGGISLGTLIGILMIFGALVLFGVYLITRRRK